MEKVYIVLWHGLCEDGEHSWEKDIIGVFSSPEKANEKVKACNESELKEREADPHQFYDKYEYSIGEYTIE